jgi:cytochrome c553
VLKSNRRGWGIGSCRTAPVAVTLAFCAAFLIATISLTGTGWSMPWSWDQFDQPSFKAQEDSPPPTPEGIVRYNKPPLIIKDRESAGSAKNPFSPDEASLARGKFIYKTYCAVCHGETGHGDGPVGKKYVPPTNLTEEYVQGKSDGDIYYTITYGGLAIMPYYRDSINPEDRWHLVNYIKDVLGSGK